MFKKIHYKIRKGLYKPNKKLISGFYYLKAMETGNLTVKQLETIRRSYIHSSDRTGYIKFRFKPIIPITKKNIGVRMGSCVGSFFYSVFKVRKGHILLEISDVSLCKFKNIKKIIQSKIPFKVSWFKRFQSN